jgi:L-amino acid N-acyltransferase YncA
MPTIRLATIDDAEAIAAIYAPYCDRTPISFETAAPSVADIASRIEAITVRLPWLVLDDNAVVGYAYAGPHRERAAYGWALDAAVYVAADHHRHGIGRALYTTLFDVLRLQGYFKVYAGITVPNPASVGLHEAFGFTAIGVYRGVGYKLGAWHDVAWYGLDLQPQTPEPRAPKTFGELAETSAWRAAVAGGLVHYRRS